MRTASCRGWGSGTPAPSAGSSCRPTTPSTRSGRQGGQVASSPTTTTTTTTRSSGLILKCYPKLNAG
ncbi:RING [Musa troglodytarum]|nr:RING [Musa troglodytarum]